MVNEIYGLRKDVAERVGAFFTGHGAQRGSVPHEGVIYGFQIAKLTSDIAAATTGTMEDGTAQLLTWDVTATAPVALSSTGLGTIDVWSAFDAVLPTDTYVFIAKLPDGYVVVQPINYCP